MYQPRNLFLQWHITERCNLRCDHCYQDSYRGQELEFGQLLDILAQYRDLLARWRQASASTIPGHITVTGGEPFVRQDFCQLLDVFAEHDKEFSFAVLTNGSLIDRETALYLSSIRPSFVQVSVEGTEATHDRIRGEGTYQQTVDAVAHLVKARVRTLISFTAHRDNFREFPDVVRLGRRLRVSRVWADRMIPLGSGSAGNVLTPRETREFFDLMQRSRASARLLRLLMLSHTEVAMHRALQYLTTGAEPYHCTAGDSLITVQPNGDLIPCRRMPVSVGNLTHQPLSDLYRDSSLFRQLRDESSISKGCEQCTDNRSCRGGLKCLSLAVTGDAFTADPGCWQASNRLIATSK